MFENGCKYVWLVPCYWGRSLSIKSGFFIPMGINANECLVQAASMRVMRNMVHIGNVLVCLRIVYYLYFPVQLMSPFFTWKNSMEPIPLHDYLFMRMHWGELSLISWRKPCNSCTKSLKLWHERVWLLRHNPHHSKTCQRQSHESGESMNFHLIIKEYNGQDTHLAWLQL